VKSVPVLQINSTKQKGMLERHFQVLLPVYQCPSDGLEKSNQSYPVDRYEVDLAFGGI
jgi:hypothetical protein